MKWVLLLTILVNVACFGPMYNNVAPILNIQGSVSAESVAASKEIMVETGEEGITLVKNTGLLPLSKYSNVNVFGWASTNPIYGGTGSSDNTILTSLTNAGFTVNRSLVDMYVECSAVRNPAAPLMGFPLTTGSRTAPWAV